MAGIIDYINQIRNKFQFLKWIQIVPQESLATKKSALYFVEKSPTTAEAIIVDDLGQKRKIVGGSGGTTGDYVPLSGTEVGKPVTGDIEISEDVYFQLIRNKGTQRSLLTLSNSQVNLDYTDLTANVSSQVFCKPSGITLDYSDVDTSAVLKLDGEKLMLNIEYDNFYQGFGSNMYFANPEQNDFIQKKYVDDAIANLITSIELVDGELIINY